MGMAKGQVADNTIGAEVLRARALREDLRAVAVVKGLRTVAYQGEDVAKLADGYLMDSTLIATSATMVAGVLILIAKAI